MHRLSHSSTPTSEYHVANSSTCQDCWLPFPHFSRSSISKPYVTFKNYLFFMWRGCPIFLVQWNSTFYVCLVFCFWYFYSTSRLQPRRDWTGSESKTSVCMCQAKFPAATVRLGGISPLTPVGWDTFDSWQLPSLFYFFQWPTKASAWEQYPIICTLLQPHCKTEYWEFPALIDVGVSQFH